ncbi:hypothetical protein [Marininema halotolerans]|uniref:Uncharacterized protein n=1 Tax=Marininema halotolerans TaxID=1155944 RepID=A0A1I6UV32_9BACL|nr:hypothetical protein [Marininema halotolerans]SFT05194.1 hypothetical protein SAMN05444972_1225 [Marininema halotolerans]
MAKKPITIRNVAKKPRADYRLVVLYRNANNTATVQSKVVAPGKTKVILVPNTATNVSITVAKRSRKALAAFGVVSETLLPKAGAVNIIARPQRLIVGKPLPG